MFIADFVSTCGVNTNEQLDESMKDVVHCIGAKELHISEKNVIF